MVDPVTHILAFVGLGEIDWTSLDFLGWFLKDFEEATIISVPECLVAS